MRLCALDESSLSIGRIQPVMTYLVFLEELEFDVDVSPQAVKLVFVVLELLARVVQLGDGVRVTRSQRHGLHICPVRIVLNSTQINNNIISINVDLELCDDRDICPVRIIFCSCYLESHGLRDWPQYLSSTHRNQLYTNKQ